MRCWWAVLAMLASGCHVVFDLESVDTSSDARTDGRAIDGVLRDASVDAPPVIPFGTPKPVGELNGANTDDDPTVAPSGLEMYFNSTRSGGGDIFVAKRTSATGAWTSIAAVTMLNTANNDNSPRLSHSGLSMYLSTEPGYDIYVSTRATLGEGWSAPVAVTELNSTSRESEAVMTSDERSIYFSSNRGGNYDLYVSTRDTVTDLWGPPTPVPGINSGFDDDSPFTRDGLTIVFSSRRPGSQFQNTNLWIATRPTVADDFGPAIPLDELNTDAQEEDPWLSADGSQIWFATARDGTFEIYTATR